MEQAEPKEGQHTTEKNVTGVRLRIPRFGPLKLDGETDAEQESEDGIKAATDHPIHHPGDHPVQGRYAPRSAVPIVEVRPGLRTLRIHVRCRGWRRGPPARPEPAHGP